MTNARVFTPPGPGAWELETTHYSRPVTRFTQEANRAGFAEGFCASAARFGLMLSHLEPNYAQDFTYMRAVGFGAPPDAKGPPPKLVMQLLTRLVPKMRQRMQTAFDAMENRQWRSELKRWDEVVKPAAIARHRALQSTPLDTLDDAQFAEHLRETSDHLAAMVRQHHDFTVTVAVPVGDFLFHAHQWTGKPTGELLQVLRGSSRISLGVAQDELAALANAAKASTRACEVLNSDTDPQAQLNALMALPETAEALRAYLELVSVRCLGYDLGYKSVGEMPELTLRAIRAVIGADTAPADDSQPAQARISALRDAVPEAHRAQFDSLLAEALSINRLRDERGHFSDGWALGIARRALLEAGRRLQARGVLSRPDLALDASCDELLALLAGQSGPDEAELQARAAWRTTKTTADADVPPWLGAPPSPPPPAIWLPPKGRRAANAIATFLDALFLEPEATSTQSSISGLSVSPGTYEGIARVVNDEADFGKIQRGDVLVARSTSPYFNVVLPLLGAIVTDRGGQLCHAAIVAREYGIPGVVGTKDASRLIRDGSRVRVNGSSGRVTLLA